MQHQRQVMTDRRSLVRSCTEVSIAYCRFSILAESALRQGTMLNCSEAGGYIEVDRFVNRGSIIMIKPINSPCNHLLEEDLPAGFRYTSLAEVMWSTKIGERFSSRFGLGLKYLDYYA